MPLRRWPREGRKSKRWEGELAVVTALFSTIIPFLPLRVQIKTGIRYLHYCMSWCLFIKSGSLSGELMCHRWNLQQPAAATRERRCATTVSWPFRNLPSTTCVLLLAWHSVGEPVYLPCPIPARPLGLPYPPFRDLWDYPQYQIYALWGCPCPCPGVFEYFLPQLVLWAHLTFCLQHFACCAISFSGSHEDSWREKIQSTLHQRVSIS